MPGTGGKVCPGGNPLLGVGRVFSRFRLQCYFYNVCITYRTIPFSVSLYRAVRG